MWKNIEELGRPQMTIWRMRIGCWIPYSTNTYSRISNTFAIATMGPQTRLSVNVVLTLPVL